MSESTSPRQGPRQAWVAGIFKGVFNIASYWKDRRTVLKHPEMTLSGESERIARSPLAFAFQGVFLFTCILSLFTWGLTTFVNLPATPLDKKIETLKEQSPSDPFIAEMNQREIREREAQKRMRALEKPLEPIVVATSILLSSWLFAASLRRMKLRQPAVNGALSLHLYYVSAWMFLPNALYSIGSDALEFTARYRMWRSIELDGATRWLGVAVVVFATVNFGLASRGVSEAFGPPETGNATFVGWRSVWSRLWCAQFCSTVLLMILLFATVHAYVTHSPVSRSIP